MSSDLRVLPPHLPERLASPSSSAAELVPESYTYCHRAQPCELHIGCKSGSLDDDAAPEACDFIEAHQDKQLSVHEIAAHIGFVLFQSRIQVRSSKDAARLRHYHRRTLRARVLLRTRQLAEIAAAAGFASHAQMAVQFRSHLGATRTSLRD